MVETGSAKGCCGPWGQSFFTLSIAFRALAFFGSYIGKEQRLR